MNKVAPSQTGLVDTWRYRRRVLYLTLAFCMLAVAYCLWKDRTSSVADTVVTMAFFTIISAVGSYVFGATWEDTVVTKVTKQPVSTIKGAPGGPDAAA